MNRRKTAPLALLTGLCAALSACAGTAPAPQPAACQDTGRPPPGSNLVLRAPLTVAEGLEVIISDVVIPPGAQVPAHYHPGEEFLYVLEGSAIQVEQGLEPFELAAGTGYVIAPEARHAPIGGPAGGRAIVFRVHVAGKAERIPVDSVEVQR